MVETEALLIQRAQEGDSDAFGELVRRSMRRAYRVALGITGSPDDALELSQEAFVRAFHARRKLDPKRPFYAWIHQILRRLCFNFLRDTVNRRRKLMELQPWLVPSGSSSPADRSTEVERAELRSRLCRAIEALPEQEREVIVLREFEGLRYREIAEAIGIPRGTVMSRLYSARRRLAAILEEE